MADDGITAYENRHPIQMSALYGMLAQEAGKRALLDNSSITGLERFWHATDASNVDSIRRNGLLASHADDAGNLTRTVLGGDIPREQLQGKVYLARNKGVARGAARTKEILGMGDQHILSLSIPYDDFSEMRRVRNPELKSNFLAYVKAMRDRGVRGGLSGPVSAVNTAVQAPLSYLQQSLGTSVVAGDIPARYVVGSQAHAAAQAANPALGRWLGYVRRHPFRFARGVAGKAALSGATAYALTRLIDIIRRNRGAQA